MNLLTFRIYCPVLAILAFAAVMPVSAQQPATGKVIMTVSGKINEKSSDSTHVFDLAMLEKFPQTTFTTQTKWDKFPVKFSGPLLRDVLAAAKVSGTTIYAVAVNDYKVAIPWDDTQKFNVILAHKMNDQPIPARTKGPLFVVYPFDSSPELLKQIYFDRSIWQVKGLVVE